MLSKLMCGAALASAAAGASAQTWDFTYTGFRYLGPYTDQVQPDSTIYGSFSGRDQNGDGLLSANELSSFIIHGFKIYGADFTRCAQHSDFVFSCSLNTFSFDPKGQLAFTVNWQGNSSDITTVGSIVSGVAESESLSTGGVFLYNDRWSWTPATTLAISPPPVPEPPQTALALAGLLALGLTRLPLKHLPARQRRSPC